MITGPSAARGSTGIAPPGLKKPLIAALQTTASHSVKGIITASQTLRRCDGVNSARSSPSHSPSAIITWIASREVTVGTPLAPSAGKARLMAIHSAVTGAHHINARHPWRPDAVSIDKAAAVIVVTPSLVRDS